MDNVLFKEEIASSVLKIANDNKEVEWADMIAELYDLIKNNYNGKNVKAYRGDWKRRIKTVIISMGYKLSYFDDDIFVPLNTNQKRESVTSKSTRSNYKLLDIDKHRLIDIYDKIPASEKWVLSTGKVVDNVMKKLVEESVYEHPVHSMILDPDDQVWKSYFTSHEINEIKTMHNKPLPVIPSHIEQYLEKYNQQWETAKDLYNFAKDQKHDPVSEFTLKWIKESFLRASELFLFDETLTLDDYSEADLLHDVWPFVYRAFKDKKIKAGLGERASVAVALGRNEERSLEAVEKRPRKTTGAKLDILFKICKDELGSCEVGKNRVTVADNKYLDDGLFKLPKILRDMLSVLVEKNPRQINSLKSIGFLIMGLSMELVIMDCPVGSHITRISRTPRLEFPSNLSTIAVDFLPLLEATWKAKEAMNDTIKILNNRKRKVVELNAFSPENIPTLPFSFVRKSST